MLAPGYSDPSNSWASCKLDIKKCNPIQIKILEGGNLNMLDLILFDRGWIKFCMCSRKEILQDLGQHYSMT